MASFEQVTSRIPSDEDRREVKHARELDNLRSQCDVCERNKPKTPTKDCDVKIKLVVNDSEVGWKHKHLFLLSNGTCKMFKVK